MRHMADVCQPVVLCFAILPMAILRVIPEQRVVSESCTHGLLADRNINEDDLLGNITVCVVEGSKLKTGHAVMLGLNMLMLVLMLVKYSSNRHLEQRLEGELHNKEKPEKLKQ